MSHIYIFRIRLNLICLIGRYCQEIYGSAKTRSETIVSPTNNIVRFLPLFSMGICWPIMISISLPLISVFREMHRYGQVLYGAATTYIGILWNMLKLILTFHSYIAFLLSTQNLPGAWPVQRATRSS